MNLYIVRHGDSLTNYPDKMRPLSDEGKKDIEKIGKLLRDNKISMEKIFTSPFLRAFQSAEIISKYLSSQIDIIETDNLLPEADPKELISFLNANYSRSILIVSHQPLIGRLVASLIGCKNLQLEIKKGALLNIESANPVVEGGCVLKFLVYPEII